MVFGSGLDRSPDEAVEQESYMIQLPSLSTLVLTHFSRKTEKNTQLTLKRHRKYPSSNLVLYYCTKCIYTVIYFFPCRSGA